MLYDSERQAAPVLPFRRDDFKLDPRGMQLGAALRESRVGQGLTLEQCAARTRIRVQYLEALEQERFEEFVAPIYALGFVRNYARELELDVAWAVDALRERIEGGDVRWRRSGWAA